MTPPQQQMPSWYVKDRVLYNYYGKVVTLEDLSRQAEIDIQMAEQSSAERIHYIIDAREVQSYPVSILSINNALKDLLRHPKTGFVIVLANHNRLLRTLAQIIPQVFGVQVKVFAQLTEALEFIRHEDKTLSTLV